MAYEESKCRKSYHEHHPSKRAVLYERFAIADSYLAIETGEWNAGIGFDGSGFCLTLVGYDKMLIAGQASCGLADMLLIKGAELFAFGAIKMDAHTTDPLLLSSQNRFIVFIMAYNNCNVDRIAPSRELQPA